MKHKTRKLFSIFLALVMVLGMLPAMGSTVSAASSYAARRIGAGMTDWKNYETLAAAIAEVPASGAAADNIVELLCDVELTAQIAVSGKKFTLRSDTGDAAEPVYTVKRVFDDWLAMLLLTDGAELALENVVLDGNSANGKRGSGIDATGSTVTLSGSAKVTGNRIIGKGGGIRADGSTVTLSGSAQVSGNRTSNGGGGIYAGTSTVTLSGSAQVTGNTAASGDGGGIYADTSTVVLSGSVRVSGNTAGNGDGGGIYADTSTVALSGSAQVTGNTAGNRGGGIRADGSTVTLSGSPTVKGNKVANNESNFYNHSPSSFSVVGDLTGEAKSIGIIYSSAEPAAGRRFGTLADASYAIGDVFFADNDDALFAVKDGTELKWAYPPVSTNKAIQLGAGVFADPTEVPKEGSSTDKHYTPNSYVWFGVNGAGEDKSPIQWRVLDAEKANDGTTAGMFLLSEYLLDSNIKFNASVSDGNAYQGSGAQAWCKDFADNKKTGKFSGAEQAAMLGVKKTDSAENSLYGIPWDESGLTTADKVFFLSVRELANYVGNYDYAPGLTASFNDGGSAGVWWLRSPDADLTDCAGAVDDGGRVDSHDVGHAWAARPAFNLNLDSVLFTSAAENGKDGSLGALSAVGNYTGSEWKLTVSDSDRSGFAASFDSKTGDVWTIKYSGAKADSANEYISALIKNSAGEVTYYGRLCEAESGDNKTVTVDLAGKLSDSDTLYVFNEQYNGDKQTDYASEMKKITESSAPPVSAEKAIQLVENGVAANIEGAQASSVYFGSYKQSKTGDAYNEDPIKWRVLENSLSMLFLLADQNLDVFRYHNDNESVTWEKSTMRSWLNGYSASENWGGDNGTDYSNDSFIGDAFAAEEQAAIAETVVENPDNGSTPGGNDTTDKVFLLSIAEARNSGYGFTDDNSRISTNTAYVQVGGKIHFDEGINNTMYGVGEADVWWLRSPGYRDHFAADVTSDGFVNSYGNYVFNSYVAVRPAFNLNLNSVLFTSAAVGGKNGSLGALSAVGNYTGSEWKLTVSDSDRSGFAASFDSKTGDVWTIKYSGAKTKADTDANEYISALITNSAGEITYYGRLCEAESGDNKTVTVDLAGKLSDGDTLYVFNEQYNGDKKTDYASALKEITPASVTEYKITVNGGKAYSDFDKTIEITAAAEGACIYIKYDAPPAGKYVQSISCSAGEFDVGNYIYNGYVMPAAAVTFEVITADMQERIIDLTSGSATVDWDVWFQEAYGTMSLIQMDGYSIYDLDNDGKNDIRAAWTDSRNPVTITKLDTNSISSSWAYKDDTANMPYKITLKFDGGVELLTEDGAPFTVGKVLRWEGMSRTAGGTGEPDSYGYDPDNISMTLRVSGAGSAAEALDLLEGATFERAARNAGGSIVFERLTLAKGDSSPEEERILSYTKKTGEIVPVMHIRAYDDGGIYIELTSLAPGAVKLTLDGREYLLATPGDVNLDGTMNALDWITIMRWTLVASDGEYTSPNDEGFTIKVNGTDYNLWVLLADMTGTETDNSKNSANWGKAVNAVDWITIMQLTLQAWK